MLCEIIQNRLPALALLLYGVFLLGNKTHSNEHAA